MNFSKKQIEIIDASKDLIGNKGLQNLTIKNLANKMCCSEPALYRHFKDKTEILKSLLVFHKDLIQGKVFSIIKSDTLALEKLKKISEFQFQHILKNPAIIMVIFSETSFQYNSILANLVAKIMKQRNKKLIGIIEQGKVEGGIRNDISSERIAIIIMGSMRLTVLQWKLGGFESDLTKDGQELWITIEKLIKK